MQTCFNGPRGSLRCHQIDSFKTGDEGIGGGEEAEDTMACRSDE